MTEKRGAPEERPVGQVTHYFSKAGVMAIQLSDKLALGDFVHVHGHTTDFVTSIQSMQIEHATVAKAGPGDSVGVKVSEKVRPGDMVYRS